MSRELLEKIHRLEMLVHRYYGVQGRGGFGSPHRGQGRVLSILKMQPETSPRELQYLLDMRQQSLSELLLKLEKKGYITRRPSEKDRRVTLIALTDAGRLAADSAEANDKQDPLDKIFCALDEEEQTQFEAYIDRLLNALETETEGFGQVRGGPGFGAHHGPHGGPWDMHMGPGPEGPGACGRGMHGGFGGRQGHRHGHHSQPGNPLGGPNRGRPEGPCTDDAEEDEAQDGARTVQPE